MTIVNEEAMKKRARLLEDNALNGLRLVLVEAEGLDASATPTRATLLAHFYNDIGIAGMESDFDGSNIFAISGGHRIPAGPASDQVRVVGAARRSAGLLELTVEPIGDYSTYTLGVDYTGVDPFFSEIPFKFRPGCFNADCAPEWTPARAPAPSPVIDYLSKDYDSFRGLLVAWMMKRLPGWAPTSEADLDQVLIDLFSAAGDELSDYQDRVMNEAYLGTARKRVSLARLARLLDYHIHQGNQAGVWLALRLKPGETLDLADGFDAWTGEETLAPESVVFRGREAGRRLFSVGVVHQGDLDNGFFTNALGTEFSAHSISLSLNIVVAVGAPGERWVVSDLDNQRHYLVRNERDLLTVYEPLLDPLFNDMGLYTWSGAVRALAPGSVRADLKAANEEAARRIEGAIRTGRVTRLLIQEWRDPADGGRAGRDPAKRLLVRLLAGRGGARVMEDPLTGQWLVRVRWEERDAPREPFCFMTACPDGPVEDVSLFHGNLVKVHHGRTVEIVFKDAPSPLTDANQAHYETTRKWGVVCRLPHGPLAWRDTPPGGETPPASTLEATVKTAGGGEKTWTEAVHLIHCDGDDDCFQVEMDEEGRARIRFGNGVNGKALPDGAEVHCTWQVGHGSNGAVGADKLIHFDKSRFTGVAACWNPFPAVNGRAPEPPAEIRRRAPEAFRHRQLRAVTLQDYVDRAEELPEVSRAAARYAWTGSWRAVRIAVDLSGGVDLTRDAREKIRGHLDAVRLIGEDLEIRPPRFTPLSIHVSLCIHPDFWPEDVRGVIERELSDGLTPDGRTGFFHPDRWTFGQPLHASQLIGRIQTVAGVDHVIEASMKRWSDPGPATESLVRTRSNEIIQVKSDPDHMETGFIFLDTQGGRR